jgi:peptidoglycan/LPS O-acetylase OafA/YrhL
MIKRLRELDFLRGIAIILVLFRHFPLIKVTKNMGWIGVDLFFVLSGFLVSGLLFREYIKFGNIQPKLFLIRRGFKIYPIYYVFYIPYLVLAILEKRFDSTGLLADMTFTQNYILGWGWGYSATWSLAVEEHFYFGLSLFLWAAIKNNWFKLIKEKVSKPFVFTILSIIGVCIVLRFIANLTLVEPATNGPFTLTSIKLFTLTHLRIDSLLTGVLISYFYYFKPDSLGRFFKNNSTILFIIMVAGLCWTPFIDPLPSVFVRTIGFTLLYISFGILLITFLFADSINEKLDRILSKKVVSMISKIGYCSYSIYIIHSFFLMVVEKYLENYPLANVYLEKFLHFVVPSISSLIAGMIMTYTFEKYFLKVREKYYPNRI